MYVTENIDLQNDVLENLNTEEKLQLVQWLKEDLGEEFGNLPTKEQFPHGIEVEVEVDIDEDDVINDMSSWERRSLYDELHEEFGEECDECDTPFGGGTNTEQEFGAALTQLWNDRWMLNESQKARIFAITKESFV